MTSTQAVQAGKPLSWPATPCPSCLAAASGQFCASCGETLRPHLPSAGEFVHEFIGHYVALEGRLVQTLKLLLFRPGSLTIAYLRGRRLPYVAPLRLYLTLSLVMFALIKWYGVELPLLTLADDAVGVSYSHRVAGLVTPDGKNTLVMTMMARDTPANVPGTLQVPGSIGGALAALGRLHPRWMTRANAFMAESEKTRSALLNHGFLANLPYMLIAALPLFALYLKLLYRRAGRSYGEHLVFALHANAFAFLLASVMIAIPGNVAWIALAAHQHLFQFVSYWDYLQLLPFAWLLAYLPVALRRVYGGTRLSTACNWAILLSVHMTVIALLTVFAELIGIVGHG